MCQLLIVSKYFLTTAEARFKMYPRYFPSWNTSFLHLPFYLTPSRAELQFPLTTIIKIDYYSAHVTIWPTYNLAF